LFLGKILSNAKNKNFKRIFCHRFFEILKKIAKKVEVLNWFRQIQKPFSCGSPNKSKNPKKIITLPVMFSFDAKSFLGC
jgi:hypothetical protein